MKRKRRNFVGFYLSDAERKMLEDLCTNSGMSMSDMLRQCIRQADRDSSIQIPRKAKKRTAEYV